MTHDDDLVEDLLLLGGGLDLCLAGDFSTTPCDSTAPTRTPSPTNLGADSTVDAHPTITWRRPKLWSSSVLNPSLIEQCRISLASTSCSDESVLDLDETSPENRVGSKMLRSSLDAHVTPSKSAECVDLESEDECSVNVRDPSALIAGLLKGRNAMGSPLCVSVCSASKGSLQSRNTPISPIGARSCQGTSEVKDVPFSWNMDPRQSLQVDSDGLQKWQREIGVSSRPQMIRDQHPRPHFGRHGFRFPAILLQQLLSACVKLDKGISRIDLPAARPEISAQSGISAQTGISAVIARFRDLTMTDSGFLGVLAQLNTFLIRVLCSCPVCSGTNSALGPIVSMCQGSTARGGKLVAHDKTRPGKAAGCSGVKQVLLLLDLPGNELTSRSMCELVDFLLCFKCRVRIGWVNLRSNKLTNDDLARYVYGLGDLAGLSVSKTDAPAFLLDLSSNDLTEKFVVDVRAQATRFSRSVSSCLPTGPGHVFINLRENKLDLASLSNMTEANSQAESGVCFSGLLVPECNRGHLRADPGQHESCSVHIFGLCSQRSRELAE